MDLTFEIKLTDVDKEISDEKILQLLHDMKYRLEGYSTTPPENINYDNMEIRFKHKEWDN